MATPQMEHPLTNSRIIALLSVAGAFWAVGLFVMSLKVPYTFPIGMLMALFAIGTSFWLFSADFTRLVFGPSGQRGLCNANSVTIVAALMTVFEIAIAGWLAVLWWPIAAPFLVYAQADVPAYAVGTDVHGIPWKSSYSELFFDVFNQSEQLDYSDLDFTVQIDPDLQIVEVKELEGPIKCRATRIWFSGLGHDSYDSENERRDGRLASARADGWPYISNQM